MAVLNVPAGWAETASCVVDFARTSATASAVATAVVAVALPLLLRSSTSLAGALSSRAFYGNKKFVNL